jgi:uncharacterized protein YoxC
MSAADLAAVLVTVATVVAVVVLLFAVVALRAALRHLGEVVDRLDRESAALADEVHRVVGRADVGLARSERLVAAAETMAADAAAASDLSRRVVAGPVIKVTSLAAGTRRATQRLRGNGR